MFLNGSQKLSGNNTIYCLSVGFKKHLGSISARNNTIYCLSVGFKKHLGSISARMSKKHFPNYVYHILSNRSPSPIEAPLFFCLNTAKVAPKIFLLWVLLHFISSSRTSITVMQSFLITLEGILG